MNDGSHGCFKWGGGEEKEARSKYSSSAKRWIKTLRLPTRVIVLNLDSACIFLFSEYFFVFGMLWVSTLKHSNDTFLFLWLTPLFSLTPLSVLIYSLVCSTTAGALCRDRWIAELKSLLEEVTQNSFKVRDRYCCRPVSVQGTTGESALRLRTGNRSDLSSDDAPVKSVLSHYWPQERWGPRPFWL